MEPPSSKCGFEFSPVTGGDNIRRETGLERLHSFTNSVACFRPAYDEATDGYCKWHTNLPGKSEDFFSNVEISANEHVYGADLREANLHGSKFLKQKNLKGAKLTNADLSDSMLVRARFDFADLSGTNLSNADIRDSSFLSSNLEGTDLSGANLMGANLTQACLDHADLSRANLSGVNLSQASLLGAILIDSELKIADLPGVNLSNATLLHTNFDSADLREADLSGANLNHANLSNADLMGANLSGTNFQNASLSNANLKNSNLEGADLSGCNLNNADLTGSNQEDVDFTGSKISGSRGISWRSRLLYNLISEKVIQVTSAIGFLIGFILLTYFSLFPNTLSRPLSTPFVIVGALVLFLLLLASFLPKSQKPDFVRHIYR